MPAKIIRIPTRAAPADTAEIRQELSKTVAVIDGRELYFIEGEHHRLVHTFEAFVLLCHALGVEIEWDATY